MTFPWEQVSEPAPHANDPLAAMQRDLSYIVTHTAVLVHSKHSALQMLVNTARGQLIPRGECKLTDGSTIEFQDIGMPQPNTPAMTVEELGTRVWEIVRELGLELAP